MALDPLANVIGIKTPVLIIHGEKDPQIRPYHAQKLAQALKGAGNQRVTPDHLRILVFSLRQPRL